MKKDQIILNNLKAAVAAKKGNDDEIFALLCERLEKEYEIAVDHQNPSKTLKEFAGEHFELAANPSKDNTMNYASNDGKSYQLVPLVPISEIVSEFKQFQKDYPDMKCGYEEQKNKDGGTIHYFHFENADDMEKFINRLFEKGMASMPDGSMKLPNSMKKSNNPQAKNSNEVDIESDNITQLNVSAR